MASSNRYEVTDEAVGSDVEALRARLALVERHLEAARASEKRYRCLYEEGQQALRESEIRFRRLLEQATDAIVVARRAGFYVDANSSACRLTGYTREELLRLRPEDIITAESLQEQPAAWDEYRPGVTRRIIRTMRRKDGSTFPAEISAGMIEGDHVLAIIRDITEREQFEAEQRATKAFYENVINELPIQLAVLDEEGRYIYLNPAAVRNAERRAWLIGKTAADYGHVYASDPRPFQERLAWIREVARSGEASSFEESLTTRDGEVRHFLRTATPIRALDGRTQIIAFGFDITDRILFEEQLIEARDQAEEMNRLKSAFLANISHEIRTPLTAIIGSSAILATEIDGEQREVAELIERGGQRLLATLSSVLELSMLESGSMEVNREELDVGALLEDIVGLHRADAARKGITLAFVADEERGVARVDEACLGRVVNNLVGNAIKFTEQGEVTVTLDGTAEALRIRVRDTGVGIDPAFLPYLFDAFKQESTGIRRSFEGTGLGLYISKKLADLIGGGIEVESTKGGGSTFTVTLPRDASGKG